MIKKNCLKNLLDSPFFSIAVQLDNEFFVAYSNGNCIADVEKKFYETWGGLKNRSPMASDLQAIVNEEVETSKIDDTRLIRINRPPAATDLNIEEFLGISFSHHMEILNKAESLKERMFYIHQAVVNRWNKYQLRDNLKANVYEHLGTLPNNFAGTIPGARQSLKAIEMFKDEYLLDFINVEELGARFGYFYIIFV